MAADFVIFSRLAKSVFRYSRRTGNRFLESAFRSNFAVARSLSFVPRKSTFGKKTDFEMLLKHMKIGRHEKFAGQQPTTFCAELLANRCEDMDYKLVRKKQPFFLNYRVSLLRERVEFMQEMKITPLQKRREVERHPPGLMLSFEDQGFTVHYLRGLIYSGKDASDGAKIVYFLYKCHPNLGNYVFNIESNLALICKDLGVTNTGALKMAVNMPCFLLWNVDKVLDKFRVLHRDYGLPSGYNIDFHTAHVYPPMMKASFKLPHKVLTNQPSPQLVKELDLFSISDILENKFAHPFAKPGDLSKFLIDSSRAEGVNENANVL